MNNKKFNKKYKFIIKAKNQIMEFGVHESYEYNALYNYANSCKKPMRKYIKHVLRCGEFHNGWFYMPTTKECLLCKH